MHRLLQGEVGSGKTVVALRAMLAVVDSGGQAALLAPTEVLAQQHARTVRALLGPLGQAGELGSAEVATRIALLTGSQTAAARRANPIEAREDSTHGRGVEDGDGADEGTEDADAGSRRRPAAAVTEIVPMLADGPLAGLKVDMLHGRLPADAKDDVMRRFVAGEVQVLV